MKTKYLLLATGMLVLAGGLWFGRVAWRAHRQLVTLDVYNAPLPEVLRKIEWQTWKKIRAEKTLDARITLQVIDQPLSHVLDRIATQAGAHWSTLHAVYDSRAALKALDAALSGDGNLKPAGWTKIAPPAPALDQPGPEGAGFFRRSANPGASEPVAENEGTAGASPHPTDPQTGPPGPMGGGHGTMMFRRSGNGAIIMQNGDGQVEVWSPEELVLESALNDRLGAEHAETATASAAADTAQKVKGRWTTYLAFRKSSMGLAGPPGGRPGADPFRRPPSPNDRFAKFTPGQRVQRERERLNLNQK